MPGKAACSAASVCCDEVGDRRHRQRDVVLDVRALPRLCASGIDSRRCHSARDCATLSATTASAMRPCSSAACSSASKRARACASPSLSDSSSSTVHGAAGSGRGSCGKCLRHQVERERVHHLEAGERRRRAARAPAAAAPRRRRASSQAASAVMLRRRLRVQLQRRRGDDAQRAFAADDTGRAGRSRCCPCAGPTGRPRPRPAAVTTSSPRHSSRALP